MDGIIPIYKPRGMTSHDVVFQLRKILKTKKIGHTGTLDPEVDGVLPICVGRATKISDYMMNTGKTYVAQITLGVQTSTEDQTGEVIYIDHRLPEKFRNFNDNEIEDYIDSKLNTFIGEIQQIPPMYSAVKVNGRKLYEYARNNETVERPRRQVMIYAIKRQSKVLNTKYHLDGECYNVYTFDVEIECGKGTYVRTLATQIAEALNTIGHMSKLTRTKSAQFKLADSITLKDLSEMTFEEQNNTLLPKEYGLRHMPTIQLNEHLIKRVQYGQKLKRSLFEDLTLKVLDSSQNVIQTYANLMEDETVLMYDNKAVAIYMPDQENDSIVRAKKVFN